MAGEKEWQTRKDRIDPRLDAAGWPLWKGKGSPKAGAFRTEEEPTANGPADYALWLGGRIIGVVEAKKLTIGPQNVLTQAQRYSRGLKGGPFNFRGFHCPFLYSTNGEVFWFHDIRDALNRSRKVAGFHTPSAIVELLEQDAEALGEALLALPQTSALLRPYQLEANAAVEEAIVERKRSLLVAMATGTGKTYTLVNQVYRLMKSGVAKRVLFLVDRRALAAQAVRAFSAFEAEPGKKFDQLYEVYSSRFQMGDFSEEEKFDPKVMPQKYLTDPQPGHSFVYVCTIQRMAINILGRHAIFGIGDESIDEDADRLDIPLHAFDVIVADECHRGYTGQQVSTWRATLDHFDGIRIGLTATPASHTTAFFTHKVFEYSYETAVREGHLVDYDIVNLRSEVRLKGLFLQAGENVEVVDPETGLSQMDMLEDQRQYDTGDLEAKVTAPESNLKIIHEVKKYADAHEERLGRFPKTLIFAVNDLPHTSHADQLVGACRDVFGRGEAFVQKITGRVDRPLQRIREFRNRPEPGIAVTVDLLTTGVDIPDLELIVFLRPVQSRILFEQMLGRGTRKGEKYPDKDHFTVFDCFDGTLLAYFKSATGMTTVAPVAPTRTIVEIIEAIWANTDRDYNIGCLVKRIQRIDKSMSAEGRELFAAFVPAGDLAAYARGLPAALRADFVGTMKLLRDKAFQDLLVNYPRPARTFLRAYEQTDTVSSFLIFRDADGHEYKPADYLAQFSTYLKEHEADIAAVRILLSSPRDWSPTALDELRQALARSRYRFTTENLQRAYHLSKHKALADIISMVKHAVDEAEPLLTASERVEAAFAKIALAHDFEAEQQVWLDRIREHLRANLSIDRDDFDVIPIFSNAGGWGAARRAFGDAALTALIAELNEAIAA